MKTIEVRLLAIYSSRVVVRQDIINNSAKIVNLLDSISRIERTIDALFYYITNLLLCIRAYLVCLAL